MKKILLSTTFALVAMSGTAYAQDVSANMSVLERVLGQVAAADANVSSINGIFANISESYASAVDGSIMNDLSGNIDAGATVSDVVLALDSVTVDIGDLATTVLGTVNTGSTTLGVNQTVDEAIAGSSSAVSNAVAQLGGSADTGAMVLNISSNTSEVLGGVSNTFEALNGSVGNVSTTVLGAVNTGTITSGVGVKVQGVTSGITGS